MVLRSLGVSGDWDLQIGHVMNSYRNTYHSALDTTPAFIFLGRHPRLSIETWSEAPVEGQYAMGITPNSFAAEAILRMRKGQKAVDRFTKLNQDKCEERANKKRKHHNLRELDTVFMEKPLGTEGLVRKLHRRFAGPYVITSILSPNVCKIRPVNSSKDKIVSINRLKKYCPEIRDQLMHWSEARRSD